MNERIGQLAEQAALLGPNSRVGNSHEATERFAKLIVEECIHIVNNLSPGYNDYRNQIENAFRRDCVVEIQRRFGMQEIDNG
jgi:hypothetical protein